MKIAEIGGEFELIKRLTKTVKDAKIIKGIGDDCAVLRYRDGKYLLVTTDMMVENDHFSLKWFTPYQVGKKLMEVNVSDIVAMGGMPKYAFLSMSIKNDTTVEFMDEFFKGLNDSAERHNVSVIGGDTTHGTELVFNVALLGEVEKKLMRLRSMANEKDLICVTGNLGGSTAGLKLFLAGLKGHVRNHLEPMSRSAIEGIIIAKHANAMIDVSDGLASEVKHICEDSGVGAEIYFEKIPISAETLESASALKMDAHDFALYGGEDFELVFTIPEDKIETLKKEFSDFTVVGRILDKDKGIHIIRDNKRLEIGKGFDHFRINT